MSPTGPIEIGPNLLAFSLALVNALQMILLGYIAVKVNLNGKPERKEET